jgi:hypothetical protein
MLTLFPSSLWKKSLSRRQALKMSALAGGASLPHTVARAAEEHGIEKERATAKRCIFLFLCGGPSQPDLWDLKLDAPSGVRTIFSPVQTNVPGTLFSELIPDVARHADRLALIRSMTHSNNDHNGAIAHTLLGQLPARPGEIYVARDDHPALGAILHHTLGAPGTLPPWVVLPRPFTTISPPHKGQTGGFLGPKYDPIAFDKEKKGSLSDAPLRFDAMTLVDGISPDRLSRRQQLRRSIDAHPESARGWQNAYSQADELLTSDSIRKAFDLEQEPAALRDRYGRNEYGQSLLMARRLVESGVRMVNVFWTFFDAKGCQFNLWDNHGVANDVCGVDGQLTGIQQLTHSYCTPSFNKSFPALLSDLEERGLLDDTLVVVSGEFGRTPKINPTSGRDHWAHCYTQLLAGGGVRGGAIYGASDSQGAYVKDLPVTPDDFAATVLHAFGVTPEAAVPELTGRPVRVTNGTPVTSLFG